MEIKAIDKLVKSSVQKIGLVSDLIRREKVDKALLQLEFCNRSVSTVLACLLKSAIANAQNNFGIDIDKLFVKEVIIGKSMTLKRSRIRARGRFNRINKPFSRVTIVLEEIKG